MTGYVLACILRFFIQFRDNEHREKMVYSRCSFKSVSNTVFRYCPRNVATLVIDDDFLAKMPRNGYARHPS